MGWLAYSSEVQSVIITVEHGSVKADKVGEVGESSTDCRQQEVVCLTVHALSIHETTKPTSTVTHFLQQGHTS